MKRKREEDKPVSGPPLIKVEYANLPTESRHKLDSLLHEWKSWHTDRFPEGFRPPEVLSGTLHYEPNGVLSTLPQSALPVLDDRPAPPVNPITRTMWFNVQYERTGEVPTYERAVDRPLKMPSAALAATKMKLKQLPNVTSRDARASPEANNKETTSTNTGVIAFPGVSGSDRVLITPISFGGGGGFKKQRTSQRCFNCGSYAHSLRECWKEYNPEAIEEARRRMQGVTGGGPPKRYFSVEEQKISKEEHKKKERLKNKNGDGGGNEGNNEGNDDTKSNNSSGSSSEEEDGELEESLDEEDLTAFEKLQREFPMTSPGLLSSSVRAGLGIGALDPPPWIHAMRAMGVPPAYQQRIKKTHHGEEHEKEDLPPPSPPLEYEQKEGKEETAKDALLSVVEDKGNIGATAVALALADVQEDLNEDAEDFIRLPMEEDDDDGEGDSEGSDDENRILREEVKFPGVNAPIPEGADPVQWGTGDIGGGYLSIQQQPPAGYWPSAPSPQPPPPPPGQQTPADVAYYGQQQHGYHQQEWHQHYHHHHQQYPQQGYYSPPAAAAAAAAAPYYNQSDYYGHQQQQAPPAPGGYYQPPPPPPSSVLPYQPPPPATELIHQAEQPPPPPPPPPSDADAEHET